MLQYKAIEGQSIWDIVLNTYGSFDYIVKLLTDNNLANANVVPYSGQIFIWDETLVADQIINQISQNSKIIYATKVLANGSVLSIVKNGTEGQIITGGNSLPYEPSNPNPANMIKYQKTFELQYTAIGGESFAILPELIGASIIQVTREIQPLKTSEYSLNTNTGQLNIIGNVLASGETLYIIAGIILTS